MAKLIFDYPFMLKEYVLNKEETTIGRAPSNDICIPDYMIFKDLPYTIQKEFLNSLTKVSRKHAKIVQKGGTYSIEDLGSNYGTFVNEMRITPGQPYILKTGDYIKFAQIECIFKRGTE